MLASSFKSSSSGESYIFNTNNAYTANIRSSASALPQGRANLSGFGFHRMAQENEKAAQKRKLVLDEEETTERKLAKLPDMPIADDATYTFQDDEDDESDADNFAGT